MNKTPERQHTNMEDMKVRRGGEGRGMGEGDKENNRTKGDDCRREDYLAERKDISKRWKEEWCHRYVQLQ